jgi:hypothetical protein
VVELERALVTMPGGWKMSQVQAEQPATTYAEFKKEILNEIARCLNMPFNVAAGNSVGYNYASGRLDHQTYFKAIRVKQVHLEAVVLDRILAAWLARGGLDPGLAARLDLAVVRPCPHQWFWDGTSTWTRPRRRRPRRRRSSQPHHHARGTSTPARAGTGKRNYGSAQGS